MEEIETPDLRQSRRGSLALAAQDEEEESA
jgi:hypothetical protein